MKEIKFCKEKVKAIVAGTFLASFIFSSSVFASDVDFELRTTEEYKAWENLSIEEKQETIMPNTFDIDVPDSILSSYEINKVPSMLNQLLGNVDTSLDNVSAAITDSRYNIADNLNMRVEHQGSTTECWAFSLLKSVETNIALTSGVTELSDFSERHMDYATSRTFLDGTNEAGFQREVGNGGLLVVGLAYLTNGQGAVLESDMPFEDNEEKINLEEINKPVDTIVNDYSILPTIHKTYTKDSAGNTTAVKYTKSDGTEYTSEELQAVRNIIKEHLVENGAIATMTGGSISKFYNNSNSIFKSTAYNCNDSSRVRDHAITIVGWDDNYSKDNFAEGTKPSTDGAYIVLNSYGANSFDNGYMYISYEDYFIEEELYGIESTSKVDYDNLYQHDYYGGIYQIGVTSQEKGYFGVTYERDRTEDEILESVGVTLCDYANIDVYINPYDNTFSSDKLIKVATTSTLNPGYHRIDITPTQLVGDSFAIVIKQTSESGKFYFEIEANVAGTSYELVDSDNKSFISLDGNTWTNISSLNVSGVDMSKADVCVKAFTTNGTLEIDDKGLGTNEYKVDDTYIMNISFGTKTSELLENIQTELVKTVLTSDNVEISSNDEIVKTGMKLKLSDGTVYTLIVRGDINQDGDLTLTDLSKLILHYNGNIGFELEGDSLKAADLNIDGVVNLVDVSQMVVLYNSI